MTEILRIPPEEVRQKVRAGTALLVCGYDDPEKCKQIHLEGGIFYGNLAVRQTSLSMNQEIIFYCA